jgi:hypothetical protein
MPDLALNWSLRSAWAMQELQPWIAGDNCGAQKFPALWSGSCDVQFECRVADDQKGKHSCKGQNTCKGQRGMQRRR